jgi:hypothetical protein
MRALWLLSLMAAVLPLSGCPNFGVVCNPGTNACGAGCADFTSDKRNCGACGNACIAGQICSNSTCVCQKGSVLCDGQCAVLQTDPRNCGKCGNRCDQSDAGPVCEEGGCQPSCTLGVSTECNGACVDTSSDPNNCGTCGKKCDGVQCHNSHCGFAAVAACFTTGQIVGINTDGTKGPLLPLGTGPASLALYNGVILSADGNDDRLYQARATDLASLGNSNQLGRGPSQVVSDPPFAYVVNSISHTLQVLQSAGDAGCPAQATPDAGCAFVPLDDGGFITPRMADAGCFFPAVTDGGCPDTQLDDGGLGPFTFDDGGCFSVPAPPSSFMACTVGDGGVTLVTIGEVDLGANTFPQAAAKAGSVLWVPTYGAYGSVVGSAAGQKVVKVDVTNPASPTITGSVDLTALDLHAFDGGSPDPKPWTIKLVNNQLYVPLDNLNPVTYAPEGPGLLAVIDPGTGDAGVIDLHADLCLDPIGLSAQGSTLFVSCAGKAIYDSSFNLIGTSSSGVVAVDAISRAVVAHWTPSCAADAGACAPILPGAVTVSGSVLMVGDQQAGRVFLLDISDGGLTEAAPPVQACVPPATGFTQVSDLLSLP